MSGQLSRAGEFEIDLEAVISRRQIAAARDRAARTTGRPAGASRARADPRRAPRRGARRRPRAPRVQRSSALCSMAGVLTRAARAPLRSTTTSPNNPTGCAASDSRICCFERGGIVEPAMHGAQDRGLGGQREMLELALVRVIRVADAARARQPLDERRSSRERLSGHAATPVSGTARPSPARRAGGSPTACRPDARCRAPRPSRRHS